MVFLVSLNQRALLIFGDDVDEVFHLCGAVDLDFDRFFDRLFDRFSAHFLAHHAVFDQVSDPGAGERPVVVDLVLTDLELISDHDFVEALDHLYEDLAVDHPDEGRGFHHRLHRDCLSGLLGLGDQKVLRNFFLHEEEV